MASIKREDAYMALDSGLINAPRQGAGAGGSAGACGCRVGIRTRTPALLSAGVTRADARLGSEQVAHQRALDGRAGRIECERAFHVLGFEGRVPGVVHGLRSAQSVLIRRWLAKRDRPPSRQRRLGRRCVRRPRSTQTSGSWWSSKPPSSDPWSRRATVRPISPAASARRRSRLSAQVTGVASAL